jgi:DNA-binding MarR family transcriptional regulator
MKAMSTPKDNHRSSLSLSTYQAGVLQAHVHRMLQRYCDEALSPYGITKNQWLIIGTVLDGGKNGVRLTELADLMGTTMGYLTNTINLLESRNMLVRKASETDSRAKYVTVHPDFIEKCEAIENDLRKALRTYVYNKVDQKDFATYINVLQQLSDID